MPNEECQDVQDYVTCEICVDELKETCEQKPHQVTKYVDEKHCEGITTTSCKPVTKTSCNDYVEGVVAIFFS